jgi:transposase
MSVYLGIDWSEDHLDVCFMNAAGAVLQTLRVSHRLDGFVQLDQAIRQLGLPLEQVSLGLETQHSLLIDFFLEQGYAHLFVLPPSQVKANQGRFAQSGAKDDQRDAWVMADMLRTDRGRYRPWQPDRLLTRQIRVQVGYVLYLTHMIRRQANRLRALLLRFYPLAESLFARLDSPIAIAFLRAYPTPQQASQLTEAAFRDFLRVHHHPQRAKWPQLYARLQAMPPVAQPATVTLYAPQAQALAGHLELFVQAKAQALHTLSEQFDQHPHADLFRSLPGVGPFLAPALLAKMGDDPARYPSREVVQALAGTCPVTQRSGKHHAVVFRFGCDREFRYIATTWAGQVIPRAPWAQTLYRQYRQRGLSEQDATRRVANRLLAILWKLWKDHTPYDEGVLLRHRLERAKPRP